MGTNQVNQGGIGAVVVGGEHPGLGIARSLGRRGIPICVIDDQFSVSQFSKYATHTVRVSDLRNEARTVDSLLRVGQRYGLEGWVLFPTRDETVAAVSRNRARLAEFFRVTTPHWDTVRWAWNKTNSYIRAQQLGIPVPTTYSPRTESELDALCVRLPLALKPAIKENFFYKTGAKAWRADTPAELKCLYRKAAKQIRREEIMLQEIIPGDGRRQYSYCAFFREGKAHGTLMARRLRQHPREFGRAATYVETAEVPEIAELSERFLRAIDYYGLVEIEFKHDPRDDQFKLLDVNARTWGFHSLGPAAGVDFPFMLYADQVGQSIDPASARAGVGWLRLLTDIPTVVFDLGHGDCTFDSYWSSLARTKVESVFCAQDILPSLAELVMLPYLMIKKYVVKSSTRADLEPLGLRAESRVSASSLSS
jgi:D-aspartate ligase